MIRFKSKGNFEKANSFLEKQLNKAGLGTLDKYGKLGVESLRLNTPRDTGKTAESWSYHIERDNDSVDIVWENDNVVNYVNIAVILQYGHATRNGGYVQGRDYINPAMQPIFDLISAESWKELISE